MIWQSSPSEMSGKVNNCPRAPEVSIKKKDSKQAKKRNVRLPFVVWGEPNPTEWIGIKVQCDPDSQPGSGAGRVA